MQDKNNCFDSEMCIKIESSSSSLCVSFINIYGFIYDLIDNKKNIWKLN
jgi:hypothetical protein